MQFPLHVDCDARIGVVWGSEAGSKSYIGVFWNRLQTVCRVYILLLYFQVNCLQTTKFRVGIHTPGFVEKECQGNK